MYVRHENYKKEIKMTTRDIINSLKENKQHPDFRVGDTVRVHVKIKEGEKERIQIFEGLVILRSGKSVKEASFTVRKLSYGIGVERIFPIESAVIEKIEVVKRGKVKRARLFYLRGRKGKAAQVAEMDQDKQVKDTNQDEESTEDNQVSETDDSTQIAASSTSASLAT